MDWVIGKSGNRVVEWVIVRARARQRVRSAVLPSFNLPTFNPPINYPITRLPDYPIHHPPTRLPDYPIRASAAHPMRGAQSGFTMIELLVVVSLIVILATLGMTQYRTSVIHAREATLKEDLFRLRDAIDQYYAD